MKEFKVIKTTHKRSPLKDKLAYAIISTTYFGDGQGPRGVHLDDKDDMFIIAIDMNEAHTILVNEIYNDKV